MFAFVALVQLGAVSSSLVSLQGRSEASASPSAAKSPAFSASLERASAPGVVSASRTTLTEDEAKEALSAAWKLHFGEEPRPETTAILTAQWAHETGNGQSMFNFNFGGIKGTGPSGLSVAQRTREGFGASETTIVDRFRAYQNAEEGASDYIGLLRRKYAGALDAAQGGDPRAFVQELHQGGYFTGSPSDYARSVAMRTNQLLGRAHELTVEKAPEGTPLADPTRTAPATLPDFATHVDTRLAQSSNRAPRFDDHFTQFNEATNAFDVQALDDALSRAALRIAASSPETKRHERT